MVLCKTLDQYLTKVQISEAFFQGLRRYGSLKSLTKIFNPDTEADAYADMDARVTTILFLNFHSGEIN